MLVPGPVRDRYASIKLVMEVAAPFLFLASSASAVRLVAPAHRAARPATIMSASPSCCKTWEELAQRYDGFIFDQFGVMHNGAVG